MNFFEHQAQARKTSRRLVLLFMLAVLCVVAAVDFAFLLIFGGANVPDGQALLSPSGLAANAGVLGVGSLLTVSVIGLASGVRAAALRSGGGRVARELGGTLVDPDTRDPRQRRLINVVEEIAIASGVPVPEVYVLAQEPGINAFAAGHSTADAAIAVTRGALESLDRAQLQGVIAHEFSHVLNGDMRLNIRLMAALFGILVLAIVGRRVIRGSYYVGRSREGGGALVLLAVAVMIVGYVGLFFGRLIQAAVSRQREYLADASAVQFTRHPEGIGGALKRIAASADGSTLQVDSEEVGHMLFGSGRASRLFATHPPLIERIQRIEPRFDPDELERVRAEMLAERQREPDPDETPAAPQGGGVRDLGDWIERIGQPGQWELLLAAAVSAGLPDPLTRAAHSPQWAPALLAWALLSEHDEVRQRQMMIIAEGLGADVEQQVRALVGVQSRSRAEQRVPLFEMAFPMLRQRPLEDIERLEETIQALIRADGRVEVFEYLLGRLVRQLLWEATHPSAAPGPGRTPLARRLDDAAAVLAVLARHGHRDDDAARAAFDAGWSRLSDAPPPPAAFEAGTAWSEALDAALERLDRVRPEGKQALIAAIVTTAADDGEVRPSEAALVRAMAGLIHVPLPLRAGGADGLGGG